MKKEIFNDKEKKIIKEIEVTRTNMKEKRLQEESEFYCKLF